MSLLDDSERIPLEIAVQAVGATEAVARLQSIERAGLDVGKSLKAANRELEHFNRSLKQSGGDPIKLAEADPGALRALKAEAREIERIQKDIGSRSYLNASTINDAEIRKREQESRAFSQALQTRLREEERLKDTTAKRDQERARLREAQFQRELQGMTRVEAAQARLGRVSGQYAQAHRELYAAQTQVAQTRGKDVDALKREATAQANVTRLYREQTQARKELTAAERAEENRTGRQGDDPSTRYALYDVANTAFMVSAAITAIGVAAIAASSTTERAFADVNRTFEGNAAQLDYLQQRLYDLSTQGPLSFMDLSNIAALGNQLGIAGTDIEQFTTTVAQFSTISGMTADQAAQAFGRIGNITQTSAADFDRLGSAIAYVARTSASTEPEIITLTQRLGATATRAGFAVQEVVGLAGALASLGVAPERAQGVFERYFASLSGAIQEGGEELEAFALLAQTSTDGLVSMVEQGQGLEVLRRVLDSLQGKNIVETDAALATVGLTGLRVSEVIPRLAARFDLLESSVSDSNAAFEQATELSRQYDIITETLDSKLAALWNSITNAASAAGDALAPALKVVLDLATDLITEFTAFANTPLGGALVTITATVLGLVAALSAIIGAAALVRATLAALRIAVVALKWTEASGGIRAFVAGLLSADKATRAATLSQVSLGAVMDRTTLKSRAAALGLGALRIAMGALVITAAVAAVNDLANQMQDATGPTGELRGLVGALAEAMAADSPEAFSREVESVGKSSDGAAAKMSGLNLAIVEAARAQEAMKEGAEGAGDAVDRMAIKYGEATEAAITHFIMTSDEFERLLSAGRLGGLAGIVEQGFDLSKAVNLGEKEATAYYESFVAELRTRGQAGDADAMAAYEALGGFDFANWVGTFAGQVGSARERAIIEATIKDVVGGGVADGVESAEPVIATAAEQFRKSFAEQFGKDVQSGVSELISPDGLYKKLIDANKAAADEMRDAWVSETGGKQKDAPDFYSAPDIHQFASGLSAGIQEALTWSSRLQQVAHDGGEGFAAALASIGPEAGNIIAGWADLDDTQKAELEANVRFAAYLASDAFATAMEESFSSDYGIYETILKASGGDVSQIASFIRAQGSGTADEWLAGFNANHPGAMIPVEADTTDAEEDVTTFRTTQAASPFWLSMRLDTSAADAALARFKNSGMTLRAYMERNAEGGLLDRTGKGHMASFANGGMFRGPGTGTSDSILARVSAGEYINTAKSVDYYTPRMFDLINRRQFPTMDQWGAMLASAGNSGPKTVTNVSVVQNYPQTVDPLAKLKATSENLVAGLWGGNND